MPLGKEVGLGLRDIVLDGDQVPSGILIHAAIWPRQIWAENWGAGCAPLGPHLTQCGEVRGLPACQVSS